MRTPAIDRLAADGVVFERAYSHAPLRVSLPALSVANPLAGMAFGAMAFAEIPASGPLALLGGALGLVVIITSVTILVRPDAGAGSDPPAPRGHPAAAPQHCPRARRAVRRRIAGHGPR